MLPELDAQLDAHEADLLRAVLRDFAERVQNALDDTLVGVYLKGSFALGVGDVHADVDFLVVTRQELDPGEESNIREIHRRIPTRTEHWAHVLEGSYATADQLRERADPNQPWLYVDNGQGEMELSAHDNTETFRWVLRNRGLAIAGPPADSLLPDIPTQRLREEAADLAARRHDDALADHEYLENGWGQPHEVLTQCRMLYSASTGQVAGKNAAARWCLTVLPTEWHELIEAAIADRPNPWERVYQRADSHLAALARRFIEDRARRRRTAEVEDLLLVLHWCDLHSADPRDDADRVKVPGGERLDDLGGDGTPGVRELSLCELAIARGVHTLAARALVADALDLRHRLPHVLAHVRDLTAEVWVARKVAAMSRPLSYDAVRLVDLAVAAAIAGQAPSRVLDLAGAKIIEADQAGHQARIDAELRKRYVGLSRTDEHGLRNVIARVTAGDAHWIDATLTRVTDILADDPAHEGQGRDELRAEAFGWLARPAELLALLVEHTGGQEEAAPSRATAFPADLLDALGRLDPERLRPRVILYAHLHQAALDSGVGVARVEGLGPHTLTQLQRLLGRTEVTVKPVLDLADQISVCAYEHPTKISERIHLLRPEDRFPHACRTSRNVDLDHAVAYHKHGPPGQTSSHTGQPLSRTPHRAKTHLGYTSTPLPTGEVLWRTPHGLRRIVDCTGTRAIDDDEAESWTSDDPVDRALTRIWHRHCTGQLA
ncbi:MAG: DUF4111 domain-containing protein [Actinomycetota bacterium]|nr:DUF4111 domain-containing protein [Actinomycetota bacterium]